ncbi:response regulator [Vibrio sp. S4M6]|uniref:response regulator n=1 Tax=Vibrio sinus TaxID=2946865 RepID=UPI002029C030|nr:response regulator [Vibrio sinus]MCL9779966.1 response regulator [Vibrio sinus]
MTKTKILIVDDHPLISDALSKLLDNYSAIDIVGVLDNGSAVYNFCLRETPDFILLDLMLPGMHGIDVITQIKRRWESINFVVISSLSNKHIIQEAIDAGASAFISKNSDEQTLLAGLKTVMLGGKFYCTPELEGGREELIRENTALLTKRERQIVQLISTGYKSREIAEELCITLKTVENHRANIMDKLDLRNVADLVSYAHQRGLDSN